MPPKMTIEQLNALRRECGMKGGIETKKRYTDPSSPLFEKDYFARIGKLGGDKIKRERGKDHFANLGRMPKGTSRKRKDL